MGAATAYSLTAAGVTDVVLLEADELAGGSSGKPLGGVRAQFSEPANIALGQRSLRFFERFAEDLGTDIGFQRVGYLFVLRTPADVARHETCIAVQNAMGVPSRMVEPAEARRLCPYLGTDGLLAAAWSPEDGFARPVDVVRGLAAAAQARGARIRTGARVVGIEQHG